MSAGSAGRVFVFKSCEVLSESGPPRRVVVDSEAGEAAGGAMAAMESEGWNDYEDYAGASLVARARGVVCGRRGQAPLS